MFHDWKFSKLIERREKILWERLTRRNKNIFIFWIHPERSFKENQWVMSLRVRKRSKQRAIIFLMYGTTFIIPLKITYFQNNFVFPLTGSRSPIHLHPSFAFVEWKFPFDRINTIPGCKNYHRTRTNIYIPLFIKLTKFMKYWISPLVLEISENFPLKEKNKKKRNIIY